MEKRIFLNKEPSKTFDSRTTLWRRKRSADGSFVDEQCSSNLHFQEDSLSSFDSSSIAGDEAPVPDAEGFSSSLTKSSTEENLNLLKHPGKTHFLIAMRILIMAKTLKDH